jgi:hypothetical protein
MADPVVLNSVHFVAQSQILVAKDHQFASNIRSGGICAISSKYDVIYYAVKKTLFTVQMSTIERSPHDYWNCCENVHDIDAGDISSHEFPGDITHVSLSQSNRYLCVCYSNTFSVCDTKKIYLNVSEFGILT